MRTIGDMSAGIWIIFNHQRADLEIIGGEDQSRQIWSKGPALTYTTYVHMTKYTSQSIHTRAGKSKSLIRWKRLKGRKRRKKAEKANLIYD